MTRHLTPTLLALTLLLSAPAAARPGAVEPSPTHADREVLRLEARLSREGADPRALLLVSELEALVDEATDLPRLRKALVAVARDANAHGEVRARARKALARLAWRRGRAPEARRWAARLGAVTRGWVAGPFDGEGGAAFEAEHPLERAEAEGRPLDLAAAWPGRDGPVRWREVPEMAPLGQVDLSDALDAPADSVVFLRFVVESDRARTGWLRLGTPGPTRVRVGGRVVHEDPADHPARFDQRAVPVALRAGPNPVLVKVVHQGGPLAVWLRVTDVDGDPLDGVRTRAGEAAAAGVRPAPPPRRLPDADTVLARLAARAGSRRADLTDLVDHARALYLSHPGDVAAGEALEAARTAAARAQEAGAAGAEAFHLLATLERDENRRRLALERAVAADPHHVEALLDLGRHHLARGRPRQALPWLRRAVAEAPDHLPAALSLADAEGDVGFPEDRRRAVEALIKRFPLAPEALDEAASLAVRDGDPARARDRLRVAVGLYPGDAGFRGRLVSLLLQLGDLDGAVGQLRHLVRLQPARLGPRLRLADVLAGNGRSDDAGAVLEAAARLAPHDAAVPLRLARLHLRQGDDEAAREAVLAARALEPHDSEVAQLQRLLADQGGDFSRPWRRDLREVAGRDVAAAEDADLATLAEVTVVRVHPNGLSSRVHQEIHRVLTPGGAERLRRESVAYTPGDQDLRILEARILKPDGTILQARGESERSLSEPWYRLYYDRRARVVTFPDPAPGDVVELVWRRDDVSAENMFGDYFGDFVWFQGTDPTAERSYVLLAPEGRRFHHADPDLPGVRFEERTDAEGERVLEWTARDVPAVIPEPGMPGWSEVAAFLHVSTFGEWTEVARWWSDLVEGQLVPSGELKALAERLVEGLPEDDLRGRVAAIHNYVVRSTRYVGLEFGIHGFKPYRVDQIHERRFGDCKDKASLMYALMRSVGIDAKLVLLRMRRLGRLPDYPASLSVFNHAILYQPDLDLWLDGTAEYAGTGELPGQDRGAAALVVDPEHPEGARFLHTPWPEPEENASETRLAFRLDAAGDARAEGTLTVRGTAAPQYRRGYQAAERRMRLFESSWAETWPGTQVTALTMGGLEDLEAPVTAQFEMAVPGLARPDGDGLRLSLDGVGEGYVERYASLSERRQDLVLGFPFVSRFRYAVALPEGYAAAHLPEDVKVEGRHGAFTLGWRREGDRLVAEGALEIRSPRIPPGDYPEFRRLLATADRALDRPVRLVRAPRVGPEAAPPAPGVPSEPTASTSDSDASRNHR